MATDLIISRARLPAGGPAGVDAADKKVDHGVGFGGERVAPAAQHPVGGHFIEGAEEDLGGNGRVHVATKGPPGLAVGDGFANETEVITQVCGRKALHELGRLAQLHLEHDGEIPIPAEAFEVQSGNAGQAFVRVVDTARAARPTASASRMVRSKSDTRRSSLLRK